MLRCLLALFRVIDKIVSLITIHFFVIFGAVVEHACDASAVLVELVDKAGTFKQTFGSVFKALVSICGEELIT